MEMPARYWHADDRGRIVCTLCPRGCVLRDGDRGYCYVRRAENNSMIADSYGKICGLACDPMEKKPLYHFMPGSKILSFGTIGCNMGCSFCQNWQMSKPREHLASVYETDAASIIAAAEAEGCRSIAFTYNDPIVFAEFAMDVAELAHQNGLKTVAVTAGYILPEARRDFFANMDAANVDLKSFSHLFYQKNCAAKLDVILDTLRYIARETSVWLEITNLLIPGENDSAEEISALTDFIACELGTSIPLHFSAFHPDFRMVSKDCTPATTLLDAKETAHAHGLQYVYIGNIRSTSGSHTHCRHCKSLLIERRGYEVRLAGLGPKGICLQCGALLPGVYA